MDDEIFGDVLLFGLLVILSITAYHRVKAHATRERLDRRQEGLFILATLRPAGFVFFAGVIAYIIDPAWMAWASWPAPAWLRWVGAGVFATGAGLLTWTLHCLGKNLTDTVVTRNEHHLVMTGPYRWVRHPFYVSMACFVLASSLVAANWFLLLAGALFFALMAVRTRTEEEKRLARFGDEYRAYMDRTGRFWPRLGAG